MKQMYIRIAYVIAIITALLGTVVHGSEPKEMNHAVEYGTEKNKGFINDNVLHSDQGDIHFSSYIPEAYDGSEPYALFITLPGWEGLYFQGAGANMFEDFGPEAIQYNDKMIVLSTQLD